MISSVSLLSVLIVAALGVVAKADNTIDDQDIMNPFEQCRTKCEMPTSSALWAAGASSKHPVIQSRRQKQAHCADTCICSTYCGTLEEAGMPIDVNECNSHCVLRKPFSSQPQDWKVFFGEEDPSAK